MKSVYVCLEDKEYLMNLVNAINSQAKGRFIAIGVSEAGDIDEINAALALTQEDIDYKGSVKNVWLSEKAVLSDDELRLYDKVSYYVDEISRRINIKVTDVGYESQSCAVISLGNIDKSIEYIKRNVLFPEGDKSLIWELLTLSNYELDEEDNDTETLLYSIKMRDDAAFSDVIDRLYKDGDAYVLKSPTCFMDIRELERADLRYSIDHFMSEFMLVYAFVDVACLNEVSDLNEFDRIVVFSDGEHDNLISNLKRLFAIARIPNEKVSYEVL